MNLCLKRVMRWSLHDGRDGRISLDRRKARVSESESGGWAKASGGSEMAGVDPGEGRSAWGRGWGG